MKDIYYNGQAQQDKFICNVLKYKVNGYFVEIGSNHPISINNTYCLENTLEWKGLMFEFAKETFEPLYKTHRPNSNYVFGDATTHNYKEIFEKFNMPFNMDYLQLDIEPPSQTLATLMLLNDQVLDSYKFAVCTFEHDYCHQRNPVPRNHSRNILRERGYYLVFGDVCNKQPHFVYEDWYVHPDLVDMNYIEKLQFENEKNYGSGFFDIPKTLNWQNINYTIQPNN